MADQKLWFKNKRYGWGWVPVTWQGWLAVLIFAAVMILGGVLLLDERSTSYDSLLIYFVWTFIAVFALFYISYKKGPAPRWRWGGKDETDR